MPRIVLLLVLKLVAVFITSNCTEAMVQSHDAKLQYPWKPQSHVARPRYQRTDDYTYKETISPLCLEMYKKDGKSRKLTNLEDSGGNSCVSGSINCYRGECVVEDGILECKCCPPITAAMQSDSRYKKKVRGDKGKWAGTNCDLWQQAPQLTDEDLQRINKEEAESIEKWYNIFHNSSLQDVGPLAEQAIVKQDGDNRPVPTSNDKKKRPKECEVQTASCWRGQCVNGKCINCFVYELPEVPLELTLDNVKMPGKYVGKYCDSFAVDFIYVTNEEACDTNQQFCQQGFCVKVFVEKYQEHRPKCICDEGWVGHKCNIEQNSCKKASDCLNKGKCKKIKTVTGKKVKYCECKKGWMGLRCEQPGQCHGPGRKNLCVVGNCKTKSKSGVKLAYCDGCPKETKPKGFLCRPQDYGIDGKYIDDSCGKIRCARGHCDYNTNRCVCPLGYFGDGCESKCSDFTWGQNCENTCESSHCVDKLDIHSTGGACWYQTGECVDIDYEGKKTFLGCASGWVNTKKDPWRCTKKASKKEVRPVKVVFEGPYLEEFDDEYSATHLSINATIDDLTRGLKVQGELEGRVNMYRGSVVMEFQLGFPTFDEDNRDFGKIVEDGLKEQKDTFTGGLGSEYKMDVDQLEVGEAKVVSLEDVLEDDTSKRSIALGLLVAVIGLVLFIMASIFIMKKIDSKQKEQREKKQKHNNKEDKKKHRGMKHSNGSSKDGHYDSDDNDRRESQSRKTKPSKKSVASKKMKHSESTSKA